VKSTFYSQFFTSKSNQIKGKERSNSDYVFENGEITTKGFITAGKDQGGIKIALSFFATVMGVRAVTYPAFYASNAGWLGLLFYSLSRGVPIMIIAFIGTSIQRRWPEACSLGDFVHFRCGTHDSSFKYISVQVF
jgi:Na+/proline symporter